MSVKLPDYYGITNKFTQRGNAASIISSITKTNEDDEVNDRLLMVQGDESFKYGISNVTLSVTNCIVEQMRTNIAGFAVKPHVMEQLRQLLQIALIPLNY